MFRAVIACVIFLFCVVAQFSSLNAAPLAVGQREQAWNELLWAPIHVQAETVSTPVVSFGGPPFATCAVDAVVRVSFKGQDELPTGQRFRVTWQGGKANWYISQNADKIQPTAVDDVVCGLTRGSKVELILQSGFPQPNFPYSTGWFGMAKIDAFSESPFIVPENWPPWYDKSFLPKDLSNPPARGIGFEPGHVKFPTKDVTVTFVVSSHPGETFTAFYSAAMLRVLVISNAQQSAVKLIKDVAIGLRTIIRDDRKTYSIQADPDGDLNSGYFLGNPVGGDEIAGLPCQYFDVRPQRNLTLGDVRPFKQCVTEDGIPLQRITDGVTTTVTSVVYGPVDPDMSVVPYGYVRVPAEDDVPGRPLSPPVWMD